MRQRLAGRRGGRLVELCDDLTHGTRLERDPCGLPAERGGLRPEPGAGGGERVELVDQGGQAITHRLDAAAKGHESGRSPRRGVPVRAGSDDQSGRILGDGPDRAGQLR